MPPSSGSKIHGRPLSELNAAPFASSGSTSPIASISHHMSNLTRRGPQTCLTFLVNLQGGIASISLLAEYANPGSFHSCPGTKTFSTADKSSFLPSGADFLLIPLDWTRKGTTFILAALGVFDISIIITRPTSRTIRGGSRSSLFFQKNDNN